MTSESGGAPRKNAGSDLVTEGFNSSIERLRGRLFELTCAAATIFGITVVMGLLLYVTRDAFRPMSADPEWYLVMVVTVILPSLSLAAYYVVSNRTAGRVAYESTGVPLIGMLGGVGLIILFREILSAQEWVGLLIALGVGFGLVLVHRRFRRDAALERLGVLVVAPALAIFGIPAISIDHTFATPIMGTELFSLSFSIPQLLPSVRSLIVAIPVMPSDWLLLIPTITLPVAYGFGLIVQSRRDDSRGLREMVLAGIAIAIAIGVIAPTFSIPRSAGVLLATAICLPTATYLAGVLRRGEGVSGLLFPLLLASGVVGGMLLTNALGFTGPDAWLDWGFLTSPTSRTPEDAGIYPALVGSILIVVVIALSAFPVGVGAAIYLEEYAPDQGRAGRLIDLIEINIGNLAGVPSVVYGLLGLALFIQGIGLRAGIVIVGGLTVGLLILPIVIIAAQESIRAVPESLRQGSYAMGATRWQTVRNVVLPEALPGILTGTILALGRAIGETAPLLMIGIASSVRATPDGFFAKTGAMPRQIFSWSSEIEPEFRTGVMAAGVITLLAVLLLMNGTAIVLRNRYRRNT